MYTLYTYIYIYIYVLYTQYIHTLQFCMSASGKAIHYTGLGFQSPNPQEIQCSKWEFCLISGIFFRNVTLAYNKTCRYMYMQLVPHIVIFAVPPHTSY